MKSRLAYRVVYTTIGGVLHPGDWNCRADGRPTGKNLRRHVGLVNSSFAPGGSRALVGALFPGIEVIGAHVLYRDSLLSDVPATTWGTPIHFKARAP